MTFAITPPRACRGASGSASEPSLTIRCARPRKQRFDGWQQRVGDRLGHRTTHDDTMAFLLRCAARVGPAVLEDMARAHFASAGHAAPDLLAELDGEEEGHASVNST